MLQVKFFLKSVRSDTELNSGSFKGGGDAPSIKTFKKISKIFNKNRFTMRINIKFAFV